MNEYWIRGFDSRLLHKYQSIKEEVMKARNKHIHSDDIEWLKNLQEEYREYGGWDTELKGNTLTIFALHRKYQRRKDNAKNKKVRDKRSEKFERRA